jgi:hypothetical protein
MEAGVVLDFAPDLVEKIFTGGMTLQQAAEIARPRKFDDLLICSTSRKAPAGNSARARHHAASF